MHDSNKISSQKPIKVFLKSTIKEKESNYKDSQIDNNSSSDIKTNKIIHENKLKEIEQLKKELDEIENKNEIIFKEISALKVQQKELNNKYNKINNELNIENEELNDMKEINDEKNREYLSLRNNQQINNINNSNNTERNNNNSSRNNTSNNEEENERDNDGFLDIFNGLNFLLNISRLRRENEENKNNEPRINSNINYIREEMGPPMTYQQLHSLPSSIYPRNNDNNEKCAICQFVFCYNDTVTKLRCNHTFHRDCLINRLTAIQSSKCPTCKASII